MMTIANIPQGDTRFFGTVISAYMIFGYIMYLILQEFQVSSSDWNQRSAHL